MTPQEVLEAQRDTGSYTSCRMLRTEIVDGQPATVYAAHRVASGTSFPNVDDQIWIGANGLTLKTVEDSEKGGRKTHAESHVTYNDVRAPGGTH